MVLPTGTVGELLIIDSDTYNLEAGVTTLIANRSGVYYVCQQDSDTTSVILAMNYSGIKMLGYTTGGLEFSVSGNKLYVTSQKLLNIRVKRLALRF